MSESHVVDGQRIRQCSTPKQHAPRHQLCWPSHPLALDVELLFFFFFFLLFFFFSASSAFSLVAGGAAPPAMGSSTRDDIDMLMASLLAGSRESKIGANKIGSPVVKTTTKKARKLDFTSFDFCGEKKKMVLSQPSKPGAVEYF